MSPERWRRVKELLEAAWEREEDERAAFLDQACVGDLELRSDVEALLISDNGSGEFLAAPAGRTDLVHLIEEVLDEAQEGSELIGTRIGRYTLTGLIGKGGMGAVYRAVREDDFRMQVAIKLLKRGTDTDAALTRFRTERQILADLQHPNIARLLDGGATDTGLPYFVMECVNGTPLLEYARPLSIRQRLELFRPVCAAVQYAHQNLIVHRDIKPANILVTSDGVPKLLDFGIAKLLDSAVDRAEAAALTGTGVRLMTPEYGSPEQVRGEPVTVATDVYLLGAVLYELLTGQRAHRLETHSPREIETEICTRDPKRPSALEKHLDADLDNIVLKAMRKEVERRYVSVADLTEDLDRFLHDLPVMARKETLLYRGRKFLKRNRQLSVAIATTAVLVSGLAAGLSRWVAPAPQTNVVRSIAVLPFENLSGDREQDYFADGMMDALIGSLAEIRSLRVIARESVMRYKGVLKPEGSAARELKVDTLVQGSVMRSGDHVRMSVQLSSGAGDHVLWSQTYERDVQDVLTLQREAARAIAGEIEVQLTPAEQARLSTNQVVDRRAYDTYLKGRYELHKYTREGFQKGLQYFKETADIDPAYAPAWAGMADGYYGVSGVMVAPNEAMPRAKVAALRALAIDKNLAEAHATLGMIQAQYEWEWAGAERSFRRALELSPSYAYGRRYYSYFLAEMGRFDEAIAEATEAYRMDPLPPLMGTNLAWIYSLARRPDQAIAQFKKILELDPGTPVTLYSLGLAYEQKKMFSQAIEEFQKALVGNENCDDCLAHLAHAYAVSGKAEQARRILGELFKQSRQRHIDEYNMALIYLGLGESEKVFEWLERAYQKRSEVVLMLKVEPRFDPVRADPRFLNLMQRIGFPH